MWKVTNDSVLWKGEDIGDNIKETTSKFQQFYIRMWLQHGELEDTDLKASASTQGILSSSAWATPVQAAAGAEISCFPRSSSLLGSGMPRMLRNPTLC